MFFVLFDNQHNPNVIARVKAQGQADSSERAWTKRRKLKRSDNWRSACYSLRIGAVRRRLLLLLLMSEGTPVGGNLLIRLLHWTVQEVIPSERGSLKRWWMSFLCSSFVAFDVYIPGLRRSDRFFGALLRHATKSSVPSFPWPFFNTTVLKLLPMSSLNSSFLPKPLTTIIVLVNPLSYINH